MSHVERAVHRFSEGYNCSQAVFSAYAEQLGLDEETALKIASGFGGGMGRLGKTCGAVTGAFMVLGLRYGRSSPDQATKERVYARIQEFAERFNARNSSLSCKGLLGVDISTPGGHELARKKQLFTTACPRFVRDAAEVLDEMLQNKQD
jgi:C_GCAxxG_C_C family probable redox protein